jgi:hypothetical protein
MDLDRSTSTSRPGNRRSRRAGAWRTGWRRRPRRALAMAPAHLMPRKQSAGLLLFRRRTGGLEVLLVHPGGPLWARKDEGAWSIPKGEVAQGEDVLAAARFRRVRSSRSHPCVRPVEKSSTSGPWKATSTPRRSRAISSRWNGRPGPERSGPFPKWIAPPGSTSKPPSARSSLARRSSCNTSRNELHKLLSSYGSLLGKPMTARYPRIRKAASTINWAIANGGSDCVGANAASAGPFWNV